MPGPVMDPRQQMIKDEYSDAPAVEDGDAVTYQPRPKLPNAFVCMRNLADLIKDLNNNKIDVNPEYQREVVWTADRMTGLVNSLMENYYIPPIILNKKSDTAPENRPQDAVLVCVDGKQRLSSVRAFVQGLIPCHDHQGDKWWFAEGPTPRRRILSEESQRMFLAKEFVSFEFKDLSSEQEEDLFARVQMGVQLSLAEKMRASSGPWQELARLYVEDFPTIYALMKDRARAKDFQLTLSCFSQVLEVLHPAAPDGIPILRTNHSHLPKLLSNKGAIDDGLKSHLASVWSTFRDLIDQDPDTFTNDNKYLRGVQTFAPIEMVAVTVLISQHSDTRNNRLLLGDIQALREAIREKFVDLRLNAPLWRFVWDFIENVQAIRGAVDGTTTRKTLVPSSSAAAPVAQPSSALAQRATEKVKPKAPTRPRIPRVLPPQEPFTFKREEETSNTPSSDARERKRQRTDNGQAPTFVVESLPSQPQFAPIPFRSSTPSTVRSLSRSTTVAGVSPEPIMGSSTWAMIAEANASSQLLSPTVSRMSQASNYSTLVSLDAQKVPTPDLSSYRDHPAPMASVAPQVPNSHPPTAPTIAPHFPLGKPLATSTTEPSIIPHIASQNKPTYKASLGTMTAEHLQKQWGEVGIDTQQAEPSPVASARRHMQTSRKTPPQPLPFPLEGVIDLTSDTEQEEERQSLLSSFGVKAFADKGGRTDKTTAALMDATAQSMPVSGKQQA
ncbi:hypothetical protein DE146DRAFT_655333 [Phaeosphaeria sp. MPI-PUGE-AT-0046c]|nr:hypothetical protein DE146DRAFT_655333 [Phaeosphaeria sp. MPI-PUGE-AT-0046c]